MPGKPKKPGRFTRNVSPFHRPYRFAFQGGSPLRGEPETKRGETEHGTGQFFRFAGVRNGGD